MVISHQAPDSNSNIGSAKLLSIILPTRNEAKNIEPILRRIGSALPQVDPESLEVIFVDDSTDDTPEVIRKLSNQFAFDVRLIARPPERRTGGLGGAVVEGFRAAHGYWLCVMDADLQHPPEMLPKLLQHAQKSESDLVICSRFAEGASRPGLNGLRTLISETFILSARILFINRLRHVTDPLTGFFMVQRNKLNLERLQPNGFKILLEIIVQFPELKLSEIGFRMESRVNGESKASAQEVIRYYRKLVQLKLSFANPRFLYFLIVGVTGILVNSGVLAALTDFFKLHYLLSAALATQASTLWNFLLTEFWVFRDRRAAGSVLNRLIGFALINNALLLVRGPMISLMVEQMHVHYVLANLVSIGAATLLRYAVADRLLWSSGTSRKRSMPTQQEKPLAQPLQNS